jgi:hypothetical protein
LFDERISSSDYLAFRVLAEVEVLMLMFDRPYLANGRYFQ